MAAQSNSTVLTQDLRAAAQDYKRDSEHKHKWKLGEAKGPGYGAESHARPRRPVTPFKTIKGLSAKGTHRGAITAERHEVASDSSCDESIDEPSAAPALDAEIAYSFDAVRGPNHGSQILGIALEQAVAKFENKATEKLVQDEYEMLNSDGEPVIPTFSKKSSKASTQAKDEDDYEFL